MIRLPITWKGLGGSYEVNGKEIMEHTRNKIKAARNELGKNWKESRQKLIKVTWKQLMEETGNEMKRNL